MNLRGKLVKIHKRAKQKRINFDLDIDWLENKLKTGLCEVTGLPFVLGNDTNPFTPAIDRIDSSKGYTKNNCQLILFVLNNCKGEGTYNDLYNWAKEYVSKQDA